MNERTTGPGRGGTVPAPEVPKRTVASFANYEEAQAAVDRLSDARFPVEHVEIVGTDLRYVERVTGRRGYGRAALTGAINGAIVGALLGWVFGLFNWARPLVAGLVLAIWGLIVGAIIGAVIGLIVQALSGGRRDFESVATTQADHYDLQSDVADADEASRILSTTRPQGDGAQQPDGGQRTTGGQRGPGSQPAGGREASAPPRGPHTQPTRPERGRGDGAPPTAAGSGDEPPERGQGGAIPPGGPAA